MQFHGAINSALNIARAESTNIPGSFDPEYITCFKYPLIDGRLIGHYDMKPSWVLLLSIGHSCSFRIMGPNTNGIKEFEYNSGDCLIFDASKQASIFHEMTEVSNQIPNELLICCPDLLHWRVSLQIRAYTAGSVESV